MIPTDFPGNARELESIMRRAVLFVEDDTIEPSALPAELTREPGPATPADVPSSREELKKAVAAARTEAAAGIEKAFLLRALEDAGGNVTRAARETGMNRSRFQQMLARYGLRRRQLRPS